MPGMRQELPGGARGRPQLRTAHAKRQAPEAVHEASLSEKERGPKRPFPKHQGEERGYGSGRICSAQCRRSHQDVICRIG